MWENVFNMALHDGLWAALFVALMIYVLRDTAKREKKYQLVNEENQKIIMKLADDLRIVKEIKKDIFDLKGEINGKGKERPVRNTVERHSWGGACADKFWDDTAGGSDECDIGGLRSPDHGGSDYQPNQKQ